MDYPALHDPEMKKIMSHHGWFFSAALRKERPNKLVSAVPQCSTTVLKRLWIGYALREEDRWSWRQFLRWMTVDI